MHISYSIMQQRTAQLAMLASCWPVATMHAQEIRTHRPSCRNLSAIVSKMRQRRRHLLSTFSLTGRGLRCTRSSLKPYILSHKTQGYEHAQQWRAMENPVSASTQARTYNTYIQPICCDAPFWTGADGKSIEFCVCVCFFECAMGPESCVKERITLQLHFIGRLVIRPQDANPLNKRQLFFLF